MHRIVLVVTVGVLLASSGCGGDALSTASVDTTTVCDKVDNLAEGKEMRQFARELSQLIGYQEAQQTAKATQAREETQQGLRGLAAAVRRETSSARDPGLKAAGERSARSIERSASDKVFFARLTTIEDLDVNMWSEMALWLSGLSTYCA